MADANPYRHVVTIDGPAASGKTTVAQHLAARFGWRMFDTGVLYRAITLAAIRGAAPLDDEAALTRLVSETSISVRTPSIADGRMADILLDGQDVTWEIRSKDVEAHVSRVAAFPGLRIALLPIQRQIAAGDPIVIVGRDIGTVVVPAAGLKVYLEASASERARRRQQELAARGTEISVDQAKADLQRRDQIDSSRAAAPLQVPPDAVIIETDGMPREAVVDVISALIEQRMPSSRSPVSS